MTHQNHPEIDDKTTSHTGTPENQAPELVDNVEDLIEQDPLIQLFGDHARARILMALLESYPHAMNPSSIVEQANVSRQSWYRHENELLETGLIREVAKAGNSPLYAIVDSDEDPRVEWLQKIRDWTATYRREGRRPEISSTY